MAKSYEQVLEQIETLKVQAEKLRSAEISGVIKRIRDAIDFYGLTAADLGLAGSAKGAAGKAAAPAKGKKRKSAGAKAQKAPKVVKFANDTGGTWGGLGKRPQWLRDALASGKQLSDFAVK